MRVTVIGAGAMGAAIAQELAARPEVARVQVCDVRARSLKALHDRVGGARLRSFQVDARDTSVLTSIIEGSDCVVSCAPPDQNLELARLCLDLGLHFCDLGGNDDLPRKGLELDEAAREKRVWLVPGCGLAPGLVNVLCLHGIDQFDEVEAAHLRVGDVPLHPEPPFRFRLSWSADKVIADYTNPVRIIEEGRVKEIEPLAREEHIRFGEPFGEMEAFCTQGGLSTLTDALAGRVQMLDHKTIRWPGHAHQIRFLLGLGFGEDRSIDVRTHLTYRDVLVRRMRRRLGGKHQDAVLMRILIRGRRDGTEQTLVYEMIDRYDAERDLTAMAHATSIPTAAVAVLLGNGQIEGGGAAPPEQVVPRRTYCVALIERGLDIRTRWHDGHDEVTAASDGMLTREA